MELGALDAADLSSVFSDALAAQNRTLASDALAEIESRFRIATANAEASAQFVEQFLPLADQPSVRAQRPDNPLARSAERLELILELAGEKARRISRRDLMIQIVDSRKRGRDLVRALEEAPPEGLNSTALASALSVTSANLSPLLAIFHGHGIVTRVKRGAHFYNTLTDEAREVFAPPEPVPVQVRVLFMFGEGPFSYQRMVSSR